MCKIVGLVGLAVHRQRILLTILLFFSLLFSTLCLCILFPLASFSHPFHQHLSHKIFLSTKFLSAHSILLTILPDSVAFSVSSCFTARLRLVYALFSNCMLQLYSAHFQLNIFRFKGKAKL